MLLNLSIILWVILPIIPIDFITLKLMPKLRPTDNSKYVRMLATHY